MPSLHLASLALALIAAVPQAEAVQVLLAGDSTMANTGGGGNTGTAGWGKYLGQYLSISVTNNAIGGRSARSYTDEGRFDTLISQAAKGDYVVIEFGHNDGSAGSVDNGRQDAHSNGYDDTEVVYDSSGNAITIHSYNYYITNAVKSLQAKGAIPIVSSQTPNNGWTDGHIGEPGRFVQYAADVAANTSSTYIDHYAYVAQAYNALGETTVNAFYPVDHTHTSPEGADVVAQAFVRGLLCSDSGLKSSVNSAGQAVPSRLLSNMASMDAYEDPEDLVGLCLRSDCQLGGI
ncbi:carbohydrate esterase family 12 protein [Schizophyllum commune H4-8]|uniref:Carbohydrate esterase family 12 protein n=1 Tax=Schizophyllum commune (strain H4-8 / FGSC 9210) TaxID=578458 RepID=D8PRB9_SCHCM|nr:carbohydrate esterase family 12 protein [Schizophyllum commune H4-8]KAI5898015.1 carbohydrate esterase family 12 protein [Schizophyllum commune H4-8]